jgi:hypothetical protein
MITDLTQHSDTREALDKRIATLRARLALRGFMLSELAGGAWLIHRFDASRICDDLRAVAVFADQVEGAR